MPQNGRGALEHSWEKLRDEMFQLGEHQTLVQPLQGLQGSQEEEDRLVSTLIPPHPQLTDGCTEPCTKLDFIVAWVYNPWRKDSSLVRDKLCASG